MQQLVDFLNPLKNALVSAPGEFKYTLSIILSGIWCIAFGIYTAELLFIGYNIIGHVALISCLFATYAVFTYAQQYAKGGAKKKANKVIWALDREG